MKLAEEIPDGKHGVGGVLGWPGRHCIAVNRKLPWSWEYLVEGGPWFLVHPGERGAVP